MLGLGIAGNICDVFVFWSWSDSRLPDGFYIERNERQQRLPTRRSIVQARRAFA